MRHGATNCQHVGMRLSQSVRTFTQAPLHTHTCISHAVRLVAYYQSPARLTSQENFQLTKPLPVYVVVVALSIG